MNLKIRLGSVIILLLLFSANSNAALISLVPSGGNTVNLGEMFSLDLVMDFTNQPTLGGGLDLTYDGDMVSFVSFQFDEDFIGISDPYFTRPGIEQQDKVENITFGNFMGIDGQHLIGTFVFQLDSLDATRLWPQTTTASGGPFVSALSNNPMWVSYMGLYIDHGIISTVSGGGVVPIPASAWLLASGLGMMAFIRRKIDQWRA